MPRERDAYLDLEGVAGEREVLVEEVRGRLATVWSPVVSLDCTRLPARSPASRDGERVRSEQDALSPQRHDTHTRARARREEGALTGPSTRGERGEQQPFLVCV